jgi:hypothetical protein
MPEGLRVLIGSFILVLGSMLFLGMIAWDISVKQGSWRGITRTDIVVSIFWGLGCIGLIIAGLKIIRKKTIEE